MQLDIFVCLAVSYEGTDILSLAKYLQVCPKLYPVCYAAILSLISFSVELNTGNSIEEEIKERIAAGNRAYCVHKKNYFHQN